MFGVLLLNVACAQKDDMVKTDFPKDDIHLLQALPGLRLSRRLRSRSGWVLKR